MQADFVTRQLSDLINDIDTAFTRSSLNNAVIQEQFFVEVFLPLFAGDPNPVHPATPEMWLNVAHGPFNEVSVINAKNELLFTVPPLFSQSAIKPLDGSRQDARMPSLSDAVYAARMYAGRGADAVQNVVAHELRNRAFMFNAKDVNQEHLERWNAIFARYNRAPLTPSTVTTSTPHADDIARDSTEFDPV
jgi:hypothetical protein